MDQKGKREEDNNERKEDVVKKVGPTETGALFLTAINGLLEKR